jgi:hypothetical protein
LEQVLELLSTSIVITANWSTFRISESSCRENSKGIWEGVA